MLCRALAVPLLAIAWTAALVPAASSETAALTPDQARQVAGALDADASAVATGKLCPADAYGHRTDKLNTQEDATAFCEHEPAACARKCLSLSSSEHCMRLALFLSDNEEAIKPVYTMRLFALACAAGDASGCTNRASFIRNTDTPGDPFREAPLPEKQACEHRAFTLSCEHEDSWGCAMLGQSFALGEGTTRDDEAARRAYTRSCDIATKSGDENFAACRFSRRNLAKMRR